VGPDILDAQVADPRASASVLLTSREGGLFRLHTDDDRLERVTTVGLPGVIRVMAASGDGSLLASTRAGVYRSVDGGSRWEPGGRGIDSRVVQSIAVDSSDGTIFVSADNSGIFGRGS